MPDGSVAVNVAVNSADPDVPTTRAFPPLTTTFEMVVPPAVSSPAVAGPASARSTVRRTGAVALVEPGRGHGQIHQWECGVVRAGRAERPIAADLRGQLRPAHLPGGRLLQLRHV